MLKQGLTHPKLYDLCSQLGCTRPEAIGYLELLWDFTADHAPGGGVGRWADGSIARACEWQGDAEAFVAALVSSGWLDADSGKRLVVHDWLDHCPRWVKAKVSRTVVATVEPTTVATTVGPKVELIPDSKTKTKTKVKTNKKARAHTFVKPTPEEVAAYINEHNLPVNVQAWYDHYVSNGWRVGRNPMRDWQAAVRTWAKNEFGNGKPSTGKAAQDESYEEARKRIARTRQEYIDSCKENTI